MPPQPHQWTPEEDAVIGTDSDDRVGDQLGMARKTVRLRRVALGKPTWRSTRPAADEALAALLRVVDSAKRCPAEIREAADVARRSLPRR